MFAVPLKLGADVLARFVLIVLPVAKAVAVAALPVVLWLPAAFTPGRLILALPLKLTPPIVLAVSNTVAEAAFPRCVLVTTLVYTW